MAIRFRRAGGSSRASAPSPAPGDGFGEWWAAVAVIGVATISVLALAGGSRIPNPPPTFVDPTSEILASLLTADRALARIDQAFASLCREPVLVALELEPDCETGAMTIGDSLFDGSASNQLTAEAKQDLGAAVTTYLESLRRMPALWESLEAIEIRGHSDPRAVRDAYVTNLVGSQQRALGVLLFLIGPDGLPEEDRKDLQRLATLSGASFSRPPASCPDRSQACYPQWRRVEILPVLSEPLRRRDWSRTVEDVRIVTRRAQQKIKASAP
ncbi:MAG: hypothetical protein JRJ58_00270 [Deltaproteobacteria bacterium]|nr:hypothetical protein [Deltaproteobacteria bacterium]